jgi:hypothetical protein
MEYSKIKSAYINNLLRQTSWDEHQKIDDLINLHRYIISHPRSFTSGMHYSHLMHKYDKEFLILLKEHSEIAYEAEIKKRNSYHEKLISEAQKEKEYIEKRKTDWLKAGGKP